MYPSLASFTFYLNIKSVETQTKMQFGGRNIAGTQDEGRDTSGA